MPERVTAGSRAGPGRAGFLGMSRGVGLRLAGALLQQPCQAPPPASPHPAPNSASAPSRARRAIVSCRRSRCRWPREQGTTRPRAGGCAGRRKAAERGARPQTASPRCALTPPHPDPGPATSQASPRHPAHTPISAPLPRLSHLTHPAPPTHRSRGGTPTRTGPTGSRPGSRPPTPESAPAAARVAGGFTESRRARSVTSVPPRGQRRASLLSRRRRAVGVSRRLFDQQHETHPSPCSHRESESTAANSSAGRSVAG